MAQLKLLVIKKFDFLYAEIFHQHNLVFISEITVKVNLIIQR